MNHNSDSSIKNVWILLRPFRLALIISFVLVSLKEAWVVASIWLTGYLITSAISLKWDTVPPIAALLISGAAASALINYLYDKNFHRNLGAHLEKYIEEYSLRKILNFTISQYKEEHSAVKLDVVAGGEDGIQYVVIDFIFNLLPTIVFLCVAIVSLAIAYPVLGIVEVVVFILLFTWSLFFQKNHYKYVKENRELWSGQSRERQEAFTHLELIKTLAREDAFIEKYITSRESVLERHVFMKMRNLRNFVARSFVHEGLGVLFLGYAIYLFSEGLIAAGTIYVLYSLTNRIVLMASALERIVRDTPEKWAKVEKYFDLMNKKPAFDESGEAPSSLFSDIVISNVSFSYPGHEYVLNDFSVTIPAGKITAIVGSSGSGKTTITRLLLRAYSYESGSITIGGQEVSTIDARLLRERIGVVEQHVDLFDNTVRENILISVSKDRGAEVEVHLDEICDRARINEFMHRLGEKGYGALVGERGLKLSGGERQRVGIARAIAKNPDIFLFDEATASLDAVNEKFVMDAVYEAAKGKTTIIIAHRLSTVRNADKIVVMDHGKVAAEGTHSELMKNSSHYQELVKHQTEEGAVIEL